MTEQLNLLLAGKPTLQTQIALDAAKTDALHRRKGTPSVRYVPKITNHTLFLETRLAAELVRSRIPQSVNGSYSGLAKWKINPESASTSANFLNEITQTFPNLTWRLDANALFDFAQLVRFWNSLAPSTQRLIEFIEDPCPYDRTDWNRLETEGLRLAIDFEIGRWQDSSVKTSPTDSGKTVFVFKPAIQAMEFWRLWLQDHPHSFLLTSYLDHPVGMLTALATAESMAQEFPKWLLPCGLNLSMTQTDLETFWPNLYLNMNSGNTWTGAAEPGIGFTNHLERLSWENLGAI